MMSFGFAQPILQAGTCSIAASGWIASGLSLLNDAIDILQVVAFDIDVCREDKLAIVGREADETADRLEQGLVVDRIADIDHVLRRDALGIADFQDSRPLAFEVI